MGGERDSIHSPIYTSTHLCLYSPIYPKDQLHHQNIIYPQASMYLPLHSPPIPIHVSLHLGIPHFITNLLIQITKHLSFHFLLSLPTFPSLSCSFSSSQHLLLFCLFETYLVLLCRPQWPLTMAVCLSLTSAHRCWDYRHWTTRLALQPLTIFQVDSGPWK